MKMKIDPAINSNDSLKDKSIRLCAKGKVK